MPASWARSARSVVIDFEGEGRRKDGSLPCPVLLGALVPPLRGGRPAYRAWLLDERLAPITRPRNLPGRRIVTTIEQAVRDVLTLAEERDATVAAFTRHELRIVEEHCPPSVLDELEGRYEDVHKLAVRVRNRRGLRGARDLESLLRCLKPRFASPPPPPRGVADTCRLLVAAGARSGRWRNWSPVAREGAEQLLEYNRGDCRGARALLRHAAWMLGDREQ